MRPLPATHSAGLSKPLAILCLVVLGRILRPPKYLGLRAIWGGTDSPYRNPAILYFGHFN